MTIENATTIATLDPTLPKDEDGKVEGAGHLRLLKAVLQAVQNATLAATANGKQLVNAEFVQNAIMRAVLAPGVIPNQTGNAGKALVTDGTSATWGFVGLVYEARPAAAQIVKGDNSKFLDLTGTFVQAFDTPANLAGLNVRIRNAGAGDITIPASDGRTNWIMYPGEVRDFNCDGTTIRSVWIHPFTKVFASTDNFVKPPGYAKFRTLLRPGTGGGGGGGGSTGSPGAGGGYGQPGANVEGVVFADALPLSSLVTVGGAGAGGAGGPANVGSTPAGGGGSGGASSFAGLSAPGGIGGSGGSSLNPQNGVTNPGSPGGGTPSGSTGGAGGVSPTPTALQGLTGLQGGNGGKGADGSPPAAGETGKPGVPGDVRIYGA